MRQVSSVAENGRWRVAVSRSQPRVCGGVITAREDASARVQATHRLRGGGPNAGVTHWTYPCGTARTLPRGRRGNRRVTTRGRMMPAKTPDGVSVRAAGHEGNRSRRVPGRSGTGHEAHRVGTDRRSGRQLATDRDVRALAKDPEQVVGIGASQADATDAARLRRVGAAVDAELLTQADPDVAIRITGIFR